MMTNARTLVLVVSAAFAFVAGFGCSLLTRPDESPVFCFPVDKRDPCPAGSYCTFGGICEPCTPDENFEQCDALDNDCDGFIDEDFDVDGDGYVSCNFDFTDEGDGDCDDYDPTTHPGAVEACDGRDNDCDNATFDGSSACPGGICRVAYGLCDSACLGNCNTGACLESVNPSDNETYDYSVCQGSLEACNATPAGCSGNKRCAPSSNRCVASTRRLGQGCADHEECTPGLFCFPNEAFGLELANNPPGFCSTSCRTDVDCGEGNVCLVGGTGARACIDGETYAQSLVAHGDTCSTPSDCGSPDRTCGVIVPPTGSRTRTTVGCVDERFPSEDESEFSVAAPCEEDADCDSGFCLRSESNSQAFCARPCASSADCTQSIGNSRLTFCGVFASPNLSNRDFVHVCLPRRTSVDANGTTVRFSDDCTRYEEDDEDQERPIFDDSLCVDWTCEQGRCAAACGTSADCETAGDVCLPLRRGSTWSMRCLPRTRYDTRPLPSQTSP
jgi:hypothetical protein